MRSIFFYFLRAFYVENEGIKRLFFLHLTPISTSQNPTIILASDKNYNFSNVNSRTALTVIELAQVHIQKGTNMNENLTSTLKLLKFVAENSNIELNNENDVAEATVKVSLNSCPFTVYSDGTVIVIVYVPNKRASNCVKHRLLELQEERDKSTTIIDFNAPFNNC